MPRDHVAEHRPRRRPGHGRPRPPARTASSCSTRRAPTTTACTWRPTSGLGDLPLPADVVRVYRNGVADRPEPLLVDYATDTIGLFDSYAVGDDDHASHDHQLRAARRCIGDGTTPPTPSAARGSPRSSTASSRPAQLAGGAFTFADGARPRAPTSPSTSRPTRRVETLHGAGTTLDSDKDTVHGEGSTLPLVIFGGQDDDQLHGGTRRRHRLRRPRPRPVLRPGARHPGRRRRPRGVRGDRARPRRPGDKISDGTRARARPR